MYNGIGLKTARGSGTNGYVQKNLSFIKQHKDRIDYKSEEELKKLEQSLIKAPNKEILDHERKRKVELKCVEMQELMEEQGYSEEAIESKVGTFRKMLMDKDKADATNDNVEKDEFGRSIAKETHQMAAANQEKNAKLKAAFGIGESYVDGSSFDRDRRAKEKAAKEEAAKAVEIAKRKYKLVQSSESDSDDGGDTERHSKKKKKKKNREEKKKKHKKRHDR